MTVAVFECPTYRWTYESGKSPAAQIKPSQQGQYSDAAMAKAEAKSRHQIIFFETRGLNFAVLPYLYNIMSEQKVVNVEKHMAAAANISKLNSFLSLPENWNGNGAPRFAPELIAKAKDILGKLSEQPQIFPTARNSVQFEYENELGDYLEFEIFDDRIVVYQSYADGREEEFTLDDPESLGEVASERFR